jgi:glycosyltransferase involved in cell wall biosynthesis
VSDPLISVVVSARDSADTIERAVRAMVAQTGAPPHEVVVVDNASNDDTGALAQAAGARVVRLDDRKGGPGQARNAGVAAAKGQLIAFTDSDCYPEPGWLAALHAGFGDADLVAGPVLPDPDVPGRSNWDRTIAVREETTLYPTANLAVRRSLFEASGGFTDWYRSADPEAPAHPYGEDTVLAWRLIRAGGRSAFAPEAVVHHAVFPEGAQRWVERHLEMQNLPALVRQVPELRSTLLIGRLFVSKRTLGTTLALAGLGAAMISGRRAPLLAAAPLAYLTAKRLRLVGPTATAVYTAADLASTGALVYGSARARTLVL